MDKRIVDAIYEALGHGFERDFFKASIANLSDEKNKLRFNNFAYSMRELIRNVLDRLAPYESVVKCSWFVNETGNEGLLSRAERIKYAIQGGIDDDYLSSVLGIDIRSTKKALKDSVSLLSKYTHVNTNTFDVDGTDTDQYVDSTLISINNLFEVIDELRGKVIIALDEHIQEGVIAEALYETIQSLDELATHHFIDEVYVGESHVDSIDCDYIHISASGSVSVELQWGSNSDVRNDNGAQMHKSFPLSCELKSLTMSPDEFEPDLTTLIVNTDSWFE